MRMMRGIDVSKWQGAIDFRKVKASGIDFVIIRAGFGKEMSQKDPFFEKNYAEARAAGLHVGAYWYSYADTIEDAKKEAQLCISVIKGKEFDFPIYFDVEEKKQFKKGKNFCDSIITVFCDALEAEGYFAGLYISASPLMSHVSESIRKRYTIWVAQYGPRCTYKGDYGIWQYSSKGTVPGVNGNCDMDESYIDFPAIIGKPASSTKTIDEIAREVIDGQWGNGADRRTRLAAAGYNYKEVQARVNALMK